MRETLGLIGMTKLTHKRRFLMKIAFFQAFGTVRKQSK